MTFGAPWALAGLALLPVLWWLHRRARRPPELDVPSLLFLEAEARPEGAPVARRLDVELLLALVAAACLVGAAAAPTVRLGPPGRTVRVVALGGAAATAPALAARTVRAIEEVRAALGPADRLDVERVPADAAAPRPSDAALLAAVRAGRAARRVVVSDRAPDAVPSDVAWVAVGDPGARNLGIVAADVAPAGEGLSAFVNVANDGPEPATATLRVVLDGREHERRTVDVAAGGFASATFDLPSTPVAPERVEIALDAAGRPDAVPADDRVALDRRPLAVRFDAALPAPLREAVERGLEVVLGTGGLVRTEGPADLRVTTSSDAADGRALVLTPLRPADVPSSAPGGPDAVASADPLAKDLSAAQADLVYAPGADRTEEGDVVVLGRRTGDRVLPVVVRRGRAVRFAPDPTRGAPAPVDTPLWPLFLENLVRDVAGAPTRAGYRVSGLLDPASSRVGRDVRPLDASFLTAVPPDLPPAERPLTPWLVAGALACLALLWVQPSLRRASARVGQGRHVA